MRLLIILSSLLFSPVTPFTTISRSSSSALLSNRRRRRSRISNSSVVLSMSSSDASSSSSSEPKKSPATPLSVAILGGGISGLSCASQLLSRHKQQCYQQQQQEGGGKEAEAEGGCCNYELEVTIYDTGRLRPGGRCSSRFVGDTPAIVKNRSSGVTPVRACDADEFLRDDGTNDSNELEGGTPSNILKAIYSSSNSSGNGGDSMARVLNSMGPIDHAAQIISVPKLNGGDGGGNNDDGMEEFQKQVVQWLASDVLECFPKGSVCELLAAGGGDDNNDNNSIKLEPLHGDMYYGKGGMGNIPLAMRDYCLSFNGYGENYTGQSFHIAQDVWVSPSNGVKYIGSGESDDEGDGMPKWELRAGSKSLGKYHKLVIAHNGKCADRIMSKTPAKEFHSLLRTKFAPYVPQWGGREMTLNSIYSLVFAVKSDKGDDDGSGGVGTGSIAKAISNLCTSSSSNSYEDGVYTIMIKNEPTLRLLSCNSLKHHHPQNPNSQSNIQIYTLLSSPKFGKQFKGPQEALPLDLQEKVSMIMLSNLENSLGLQEGDVVNEVVDLKLQLWGAAVPMNTWSSSSLSSSSSNGVDGFVYDAAYGVGAAGDWILDPSIAGAWESGRRLADWILNHHEKKQVVEWSVGLPDFTNNGGKQKGKFVPSRVALESGIGTIPLSPNSTFEFPSNSDGGNQQQRRQGGRGGGRGRGRGRGPGRGGRGGRGRGGSGGGNGQRASNGGGRNSNRREMQQQKVG